MARDEYFSFPSFSSSNEELILNCRIFKIANISNRFSSANWKSYPHVEKPSRRYVDMFSSAYGRIYSSRKSAHAQTENQESSTSERGARASYWTMFPKISPRLSLLEPSFRWLLPDSEGEKRLSFNTHTFLTRKTLFTTKSKLSTNKLLPWYLWSTHTAGVSN